MDLAVYQDLFVNFEAFGPNFNAALQSAIDAWAQAFNFFGTNDAAAEAGAEAGAEAQINGLSSQFGLGAEAGAAVADSTESAQNGGLNLNLETAVEANL